MAEGVAIQKGKNTTNTGGKPLPPVAGWAGKSKGSKRK